MTDREQADRYTYREVSDPCSCGLFAVYDGNLGREIKHFYFRSDAENFVSKMNAMEPKP